MIEFVGNSKPFQGYLSASRSGSGPGIIVIQEWWGLVGHIKDVADRFSSEGFTALAPDFYHGRQTNEPDEAGSLMMALEVPDAEKVINGAVSYLLGHPSVGGGKVGVVGFCMGGQLSMYAASINGRIGACVNYYGIHPNVHPPFEKLQAPVLGLFAEHDDYASPAAVASLDETLTRLGKSHTFTTYPGVHHAFFNSDRPQVYDAAAAENSWRKTVAFFRSHLG